MPDFQLVGAAQVPPDQLHRAFCEAFSDYIAGPPQVPAERWGYLLARQGVALPLSRVAMRHGQVLAFALVAPRPDIGRWRLATMGAVAAARGGGAAPALLDDLAGRARAAGVPCLELEVFAQNQRAIGLYRRHGFVEAVALRGHERTAPANPAGLAPAPQELSFEDGLNWLREAARGIENVPLQVTAPVLAALSTAPRVWRRGHAQLMFDADGGEAVLVHSLFDRSAGQADAESLLQALLASHPGRTIKVPPLQRDDLGGQALQRSGFAVQPLHQWLMQRAV